MPISDYTRMQGVEAICVREAGVDDIIVVDPIWGREKVLKTTEYVLGNGVTCRRLHLAPYRRDQSTRFVVRGEYEPILRMWVDE